MSLYAIKLTEGEHRGACLTDDEQFTFESSDWLLFESATEATLTSFGLPYPVEVQQVGAELAGCAQ